MTKKIFKSNILVAVVVLIFGIACVMAILYQHFGKQIDTELKKEATYLAYGVDQQGVDYLKNIKDKNARITYIDQDGTVLYDNKADAAEMENHSDRKEFQKAEKYGVGESSRYSDTLSEKTIYYAQRLKDGTVLRVSGTQDSVLALIENLVLPLVLVLFLMLILSGIMASVISKRIVKPVNELDLEHPEENQIYEELSPLLSKIHRQNREIQNQLELAKQQQAEFSLITENMQEGLIVIDKYTMILSANSNYDSRSYGARLIDNGYLQDDRIGRCMVPVNGKTTSLTGWYGTPNYPPKSLIPNGFSQIYNIGFGLAITSWSVPASNSYILLGDSYRDTDHTQISVVYTLYSGDHSYFISRHAGKANFAFLDGHAESVPVTFFPKLFASHHSINSGYSYSAKTLTYFNQYGTKMSVTTEPCYNIW